MQKLQWLSNFYNQAQLPIFEMYLTPVAFIKTLECKQLGVGKSACTHKISDFPNSKPQKIQKRASKHSIEMDKNHFNGCIFITGVNKNIRQNQLTLP